ncbi:type 2 periplasmic-binding domain-containing protein [Spartinivicinus ruber]|uniref:transporter substrate-binding domain-containing protein n=1 Tax=Spartinivicinus ruber TaxID=2683272 RepID=UPI0013D108C6|nr:transporter substrate-binding domain-containing protein [Spartinivicinus ruber]
MAEAFSSKGVKVDFQWIPWKRVLFMTKNGDLDVTPGWSRNKEREEDFLFSEQPVLIESAHLFYKTGRTITWNEIADLKKYRFVGLLGYNYQYLENEGIKIYLIIIIPKLYLVAYLVVEVFSVLQMLA